MKRVLLFLTLALVMVSCGTRKGYFTIEGRFLNLNQGEFYVYSTDGVIDGVDTIKVNGGRFALEIPCAKDGTLILVFPNFSEQPVFAESGKSVDIKADASHLKEMKVTGTDDNELMNDFRQATASSSPPEIQKMAEHFISDNPESLVATYLLRKYFISNASADKRKAAELLGKIKAAQPQNVVLVRMEADLKLTAAAPAGSRLPAFSVRDINGSAVSSASFKGKTAVICTWASWSSESGNMMRQVSDLVASAGGSAAALGISLDASAEDCRNAMEQYGVKVACVCDGMLFGSPLLRKLGLGAVPANIIVGPDGKVVARDVALEDLDKYLKAK